MEQHVNSICRSCYIQIRKIGYIRKYLTVNATKALVNSLITSRIDYCNSLLYGVPKTVLNKLQHVQNTAARLISRTSRYDHITPVLRQLHWLPIQDRICFKLLLITYKALHGQCPLYTRQLLQVHAPARNLRSQNNGVTLTVPRSRRVTFGDRSFATAAPRL